MNRIITEETFKLIFGLVFIAVIVVPIGLMALDIHLEEKELEKVNYVEELRDPTYLEMEAFLADDRTSSNTYDRGSFLRLDDYVCIDFANDVKRNAIKEGIRCAGVGISFGRRGHALIAFQTTDRGIIFIEPQDDYIVKVAVGTRYFVDNGCEAVDYNDTIVKVEVYWPKTKNKLS